MTAQRIYWPHQTLYILLFLSVPGIAYVLWLNYFVYNLTFLRPLWFMNIKPQLFTAYCYIGMPCLIAGISFIIMVAKKKYFASVLLSTLSYFIISLTGYAFISWKYSHRNPHISDKSAAYNLYCELIQTFYISPFTLFNLFGLILVIVLATLLALRLWQDE